MLNKKNLFTLALGSVLAAIFFGLYWTSPEKTLESEEEENHSLAEVIQFTPEQIKENGIEIVESSSGKLKMIIKTPAKITINNDKITHLFPKIPGIVVEARKNLGENVQEGEILVIAESREMADAKAEFLTTLKKQRLLSSAFEREHRLFHKQINAIQDYQEAIAGVETGKVSLILSHQKLHALGLTDEEISSLEFQDPMQLRLFTLRAPLNGTIIKKDVAKGQFIGTDHDTYLIANLEHVWAELTLYASTAPFVTKGLSLELCDQGGCKTAGEILFVNPIIDEETRTTNAIALLNNASGHWQPGTFAWGHIIAKEEQASVVIPKTALQKIEGQDVVFVQTPEGFVHRNVLVGKEDEDNAEILSGLELGERYANGNTFLLKAELLKETAQHMD